MVKFFKYLALPLLFLTICILQIQAGTLHDLANNNDFNKLASFLEKNGNSEIDTIDATGQTPLFIACQNYNIEIAWLLIKHGANVNTMITSGIYTGLTPLLQVCGMTNNIERAKELAQLLIEHDANVNIQITNNWYINATPLTLACMSKNDGLAKLLIKHGANANIAISLKNANGTIKDTNLTALFIACTNQDTELAKFLVHHGAKINCTSTTPSHIDATPFFIACTLNNTELARFLIEHNADITAKCTLKNINGTIAHVGVTALFIACKTQNTELIKLLIKNGGSTTHGLVISCKLNNSELAKFFLENGALVNTTISELHGGIVKNIGRTTLLSTCKNGNTDLAKLLITYGANPHIPLLENALDLKKGITAFSFIKTNWPQKVKSTLTTLIPFKKKSEFNDIQIFMQLIFNQLFEQSSLTQPSFKFSDKSALPQLVVNQPYSLIHITEDFISTYLGEKPLPYRLPKNPFSRKTDPLCNTICTTTPFALWLKMNFNMTMEQYGMFHCFFRLARALYRPKELSLKSQESYKKLNDIAIKFLPKICTPVRYLQAGKIRIRLIQKEGLEKEETKVKKGIKRKFNEYKDSQQN